MLYALLAVTDLFCLILYSVTKQPNVVLLMISGASILMIRVLVKEQECIVAHNQAHKSSMRTPWLTLTRDLEKPRNINITTNNRNNSHNPFSQALWSLRSTKQRARHTINNPANIQIRRRGAGMTDIERVTLYNQNKSAASSDQPGVESFIAEWTRAVGEAALKGDDRDEIHPAGTVRNPSGSLAQEYTGSSITGDGRIEEAKYSEEEEEDKSHSNSPVGIAAIPSLDRLASLAPVRFSRTRSSSFHIGSRHISARGGAKTIF
ncbi:hypothetical protein CBS101457_001428 [Exobasidium rhododendri]|nr:hypothetical protein CBS101457_001428 [Exobasidium rhododendri]